MNNKATLSALTEIIIGVIIAFALFALIFKFYPLLSTPKCENSADFDLVSNTLSRLDEESCAQEEIFFNNNCKLVSFSSQQAYNKIPAPQNNPKTNSYICLCILDSGSCKSYKCKGLDSINQINEEQFSTEDLKDYTFLTFTKEGAKLKILTANSKTNNPNPCTGSGTPVA